MKRKLLLFIGLALFQTIQNLCAEPHPASTKKRTTATPIATIIPARSATPLATLAVVTTPAKLTPAPGGPVSTKCCVIDRQPGVCTDDGTCSTTAGAETQLCYAGTNCGAPTVVKGCMGKNADLSCAYMWPEPVSEECKQIARCQGKIQ